MQPAWKTNLAIFVVVPLATMVGCQKGGDSGSPTAAVSGSNGDKGPSSSAGMFLPRSDQDPFHPIVEVDTTLGKFTVRLDRERAPITVDNFLNYVDRHQYDSTIFHQVLRDSPKVILGGGYSANLAAKKTLTPIRNEAHNGLKNRRGTIAMARRADNEDSATSHFFINLADNEVLDHKARTPQGYGYCVFGEVTEGLETIDRIGQVPVHDIDKFDRIPAETVTIKSARRVK